MNNKPMKTLEAKSAEMMAEPLAGHTAGSSGWRQKPLEETCKNH